MASGGYYQSQPGGYGHSQQYGDYQQGYGQQQGGYGADDRRVTHGYGGFSQQNPYADEHEPMPAMPQAYGRGAPPSQGYEQQAPPQGSGYGQAPQRSGGGYGQAPSQAGYGQAPSQSTGGYGQAPSHSAGGYGQSPPPQSAGGYGQSPPSQGAGGYGQAPQGGRGYGGDMYGGASNRHQDYAANYGSPDGQQYGGPPTQHAPQPQQPGNGPQQGGWDHPFPIFPAEQNGYRDNNANVKQSMDIPRQNTAGHERVSPIQPAAQPAYAPYKQEYASQGKTPNFGSKPARIDTTFAIELPTPSNEHGSSTATANGGFDFGQTLSPQGSYANGSQFNLPVRPGTAPDQPNGYGRPPMNGSAYPEPPRSAGLPPQRDMDAPPQSPPTDRGYWGDYEPGNIPKDAAPKFAPPPPGFSHRPPPPPMNEQYDRQPAAGNWNDVPDYGPRAQRGRGDFRPPARSRTEPAGWDGRGYDPRSRGPPSRGKGGPPGGFRPDQRGGRGGPPPPRRADTYDNHYGDYDRNGPSSGYGRGPPPRSGSARDARHDRSPQPPGSQGSRRGPPPSGGGYPEGKRSESRNGAPSDRSRPPYGGAGTSLSPPAVDGRPSTATGSERPPQDRNGPQSPPNSHQRTNSDSLPHHPTPQSQQPARPGLQNDRPPPVRQYSPPKPESGKPGKPPPITQQELSRVRQEAQRDPSNLDAQFTLAKKLSEASTVLISTGDPKLGAQQKRDFNAESLKILKQIINKHHVEATFYLADCYSSGRLDLPNDPREAFALYQQAAKLGHPEAAYRTAVCCEIGPEDGGGTRKDTQKAVQWYKHAANVGSVGAMFKLGMIQLRGMLGTEKDYRSAISWLQRASENADEEHPHACYELAVLYENPPSPALLQKNEEFAFSLYLKAAKLGHRASQFKVGHSYEYGHLGCQIDARNSIVWYTKAAAQGEHQSELALSGWYLTGAQSILEQSDTEAYLWARKAANANITDPMLLGKAMYAMGYFTEVGIGCPRSLDEARKWYNKSAAQGFPKAQQRLEEMRKQGEKAPQRGRERLSRNNPKQHEQDCTVM